MNLTYSERDSILRNTYFDDETESFSFLSVFYEVREINNTKNVSYEKIENLIF